MVFHFNSNKFLNRYNFEAKTMRRELTGILCIIPTSCNTF